jgi:hypothetical protein
MQIMFKINQIVSFFIFISIYKSGIDSKNSHALVAPKISPYKLIIFLRKKYLSA